MAFLVGVKIAEPGLNHIVFGRNGIRCTLLCNIGSDGLRSVCFITQDVTPGNAHFGKQIDCRTCVKDISAGKEKMPKAPQGIHNSMDFCGLSTVAYADKLVVFRIYSPFSPALYGCALIEVLSMHRLS